MPYPIFHLEGSALHGIPSCVARLVQIDEKYEAQKNWREASFQEFLEQGLKVYLVKSFGEIKKAAVNFRAIPEVLGDSLLYCPCTLNCGAAFLQTKLKDIIGEECSKEEENAVIKDFKYRRGYGYAPIILGRGNITIWIFYDWAQGTD